MDQLDQVQKKMDEVLPALFRDLCAADPLNVVSYTSHYSNSVQNITTRVVSLRVKILLITVSDSRPPSQQAIYNSQHPQILKNLPRLGELKFSGKVEDWPEFKRN